jgi:hypothetical protein
MGVIDLYFVNNKVEVLLSMKGSQIAPFYFSSNLSIIIGCTIVLLMGVAPEAIVKKFWV